MSTLSIGELQSRFLIHEQRMKGQKENTEEQTLKVSNARKCFGRGRGILLGIGRGRGRQSNEFVKCYKCHKLDHYKSKSHR